MRIEINLLGGGKKKKKAGAGFQMPDFAELASKVKDPLMLGAVGAWAVAAVFIGVIFTSVSTSLSGAEERAAAVRSEAERWNEILEQQRRAIGLRDSIIAELNAIREIDDDRYIWPHILEEVSKAVPDYTWLVGLQVIGGQTVVVDSGAAPPVRFQIQGRTSEIAAYTRFLRQLANSPWVALVEDGPARRVDEDGRSLTSFEMFATFKTADSAFILRVPVTESTR